MAVKIMCVDDSNTIRMLVRKTLVPEGYELIEAENGEDALSKLDQNLGLFIVDVNMPVMNGFQFVETVKNKSGYNNKPMVFLTTESGADKKQAGKELGVNGWIVKPFEPESLLKIVKLLTD